MIKFSKFSDNGRTLIGIGLSDGNIEKLKAGMPIHFFMAELVDNSKMEVLIFHGKDEAAMKASLEANGMIVPAETEYKP